MWAVLRRISAHGPCPKQDTHGLCKAKKCLAPTPCPALRADHTEYTRLLRRLRALPGIKRVFIRSGIRYDYLMQDPDDTFFKELVRYHVSGQLKVASRTLFRPSTRPDGQAAYPGV